MPTNQTLRGVTYGDGTYVAVGNSGTIVTSSDGTNWTSVTPVIANTLNGVTYGNGTYVAVGGSGGIVTSSDGTNWTRGAFGSKFEPNGVTYGNGTYVAVGDFGRIVTSSDGTNWTSSKSSISSHLNGVTYGNGTYVAMGDSGRIMTSSDGTNWTSSTSGTTNTLNGVTYSNGTYVAVGNGGRISTSSDGASWTSRESGTTNTLNGVTYGNGTYVAVGISGNILQTLVNAAAPVIDTQPTDATVNEGDSAPLSVAATVSDSGTLSYQWYSHTANSNSEGTVISGATSASYAAPTATAGTTYYYAVVTNTNNSVNGTKTATATSSAVKVTVNVTPTYSIAAIANQTATALIQGYETGTQDTKTIYVTNAGTGNLANLSARLSGANVNDFVITQPASPLNSGAPATSFTVNAKDGLAAGTYTATVMVSADNMTDVTFTMTQVVNLPNVPENPQNLVATGGDRQVALNWSTVTGATYYNLYMSMTSGQFSSTSVVTVTDSTYNVQNLTNGTTYYFIVKAGNLGGLSAESNQASVTPATVAAAPTNVSAAAGNGQATMTFTAPSNNGGSAITGYEVTASPGGKVMAGTASPITITGLTNGMSYTFTVKAINGVGSSASSAPSNDVMPRSSSSGGSSDSSNTNTETANTGVEILVNGKAENAGTATITNRNDQTVTTIAFDPKKLVDKLAAEGLHAVVTIPVNSKSDVIVGELNGQMIKHMEDRQAVLEIKSDRASYTLPAQQINISAISDQFGKSVNLQDIKLQIEIAAPTTDTVKVVENAAVKGAFALVVPSVEFTVGATYGETTIEVSKFDVYVERTIVIPEGVDPNKITTGVVIDPDGTVRHVPTQVAAIDGKYYAIINSLTNSTYAVVWHPLEFSDVANHWAKAAVNDMGSRMVVSATGNGLFSPNRNITRAEFAAIIVRGLGLKLENGTAPFPDVKISDWYQGAVQTAYVYGLISGFEDGTFRPNDNITREQAMVMIAKAMAITGLKAKLPVQSTGDILQPYTDEADASTWALRSIADSVHAGIVSGRNGAELAPKALITRAEVAAIVQRLLQKSELI
ncbi:S-layer homology domain-containing protein [Paenibacillus sp. sgz302251]|uniref:S-layer homology domain-containing protein n=1 Tax=Paenibacillus sp. sgz302251 TaxID=3414493 RepID=UPI003C7D459A